MEAGTTVQITMPQMGDSVAEGTVIEWRKRVGDRVEADEIVVEVRAPAAGTITEILVEPGQVGRGGGVLGAADSAGRGAPAEAEAEAGDEGELVDVGFPQMGDSVAEGTVIEWRKQV